MSDRLYRAETFIASDGYPGIRLVELPEGSAVIPPELVEAWWDCQWFEPDGEVGDRLEAILRAARSEQRSHQGSQAEVSDPRGGAS